MKTSLLTTRVLVGSTISTVRTPDRMRFFGRPFLQLLSQGLAFFILGAAAANAAHTSSVDDQKIVASLDTQYQAAVKKNDATTMDRILADDFVLVTGSGKTYGKADLLEEARSGRVLYEHQEDPRRPSAFGAIRRWSLLSCGRKARTTESQSTIRSGSATLTCAPRRDGGTSLANPRCPCPSPNE